MIENDFDIQTISETWLSGSVHNSEIVIQVIQVIPIVYGKEFVRAYKRKKQALSPWRKKKGSLLAISMIFFCSVGQNTFEEIHSLANEFNYDLNRSPFNCS